MAQKNKSQKKIVRSSEMENTEEFIKEMMEQRKIQKEALNKIISYIDTADERMIHRNAEKKIPKKKFNDSK